MEIHEEEEEAIGEGEEEERAFDEWERKKRHNGLSPTNRTVTTTRETINIISSCWLYDGYCIAFGVSQGRHLSQNISFSSYPSMIRVEGSLQLQTCIFRFAPLTFCFPFSYSETHTCIVETLSHILPTHIINCLTLHSLSYFPRVSSTTIRSDLSPSLYPLREHSCSTAQSLHVSTSYRNL